MIVMGHRSNDSPDLLRRKTLTREVVMGYLSANFLMGGAPDPSQYHGTEQLGGSPLDLHPQVPANVQPTSRPAVCAETDLGTGAERAPVLGDLLPDKL